MFKKVVSMITTAALLLCGVPLGTLPVSATTINAGSVTQQTTFQDTMFKLNAITSTDIMGNDQAALTEEVSFVDLCVEAFTWSQNNADQVVPGSKLEFFVSVVNRGTEAHSGDQPFYVDILVDAQKVKTLEYQGAIGVGETVVVHSRPDDAWITTAGDHMVTAIVNSTATILESDNTNNHYTVNLRVADEEDFVTAPYTAQTMGHNRLVFSDHFTNNLTIDHTASGTPGYKWYITRPWGEADLTPNDYRVEDGVLHLTTRHTAWNYSMSTIDAKHPGVGFSFNTGYMEIRVRMKETAESGRVANIRVPSVWSLSDETIWGTCPEDKDSLELDWFVYWGNKYGKPRFDTTLYHTIVGKDGEGGGKVTTEQNHYEPIGDYQWHTYAMGWSEGLLKTYFDGKLIGIQKYSKDARPDPMPTGSIDIDAGVADPAIGLFSILDEQNMPIILGGASDFPMEVDWIHVWQSDGEFEPPVLSHIVVESGPDQTEYLEGDTAINKEGLRIRAYYDNGESEIVTGYTLLNYESTPGTKVVTVLYEDKTAEFTVSVVPKTLTAVVVTMLPDKAEYKEGEELDLTGMAVTAYYNNQTNEQISDYTVSGYTSTPGTKTITVTYEGKTATFTVTVEAKVVKGDASGDGKVTITDMVGIKAYLLGKSTLTGDKAKGADVNGDGKITITDFIQLKAFLLGKGTL